ncbi:Delta(14)-sterol reductase-like protein [Rhizodiscina lignyota]|uniref:Delta(14)-sterol reductase n=1 Tax=Rhizodiscina lignyota TaxID=1504668 RepID=A0A9P4M8K3_9PEZI|nr:Delta(14)-sterol reductase-like protein [Rhizodiscina lignyota]
MSKRAADVAESASEHRYEFGGRVGVAFITFAVHAVPYALAFLCNDISGCPAPSLLHPTSLSLEKLKAETGWQGVSGLLNTNAFLGTLGWYFLSLVLYAALPATTVQGVELKSGGRLTYRFNAFSSAVFTMVIAAAGTIVQGAEFPVWTFISDNYVQILTSNVIVANALSVYVYVCSFSVKNGNRDKRELAAGGTTGNMFYDWFIGRELNPRITLPVFGEVDIKSFMELRPGLLGWILLDCAFMAKQYRTYGYVTDSMLIVTFTQALYVFDALYMEPAILTTIDIITDGFGFMLSFGDVAWLPFTYSVQAKYLAVHPVSLGPLGCLMIFAVQGTGYYIFRATNNEKNRFRTNPKDPKIAHLKYIETKTGSKLLTSGWWGTARHINYLGDWFMSWSYCLPTGIAGYMIVKNAIVPGITSSTAEVIQGEARGWGMVFTYFYMLYFAILLVHRERRDEEKCRRKYGKDWDEYCKIVPWRIIPYVY